MLDVRAAFVPNQLEIEQEALGGGLKRGFDIVVASLILVVLAPFFVMLTILIKMTDHHLPTFACWISRKAVFLR